VISDLGLFNDPMELMSSPEWRSAYPRLPRAVQWNVLAPGIDKIARELREEVGVLRPARTKGAT